MPQPGDCASFLLKRQTPDPRELSGALVGRDSGKEGTPPPPQGAWPDGPFPSHLSLFMLFSLLWAPPSFLASLSPNCYGGWRRGAHALPLRTHRALSPPNRGPGCGLPGLLLVAWPRAGLPPSLYRSFPIYDIYSYSTNRIGVS